MADDQPENFGNSVDWWTTTKASPNLFRHGHQSAELDGFIRETVGVDPAILADEIGLSAPHIRAYQRKLGVRKLTGNRPRKSRAWRIT